MKMFLQLIRKTGGIQLKHDTKKAISLVVSIILFTLVLAACGSNSSESSNSPSPSVSASPAASPSESAAPSVAIEPYTLTFYTNNSDRTVGQGKMEQALIDQYMAENSHVTIKVETLSPDPQYQDKIKVYNASNSLPDIISSWGNTNFLKPLIDSGALAEISRDDLADYGFVDAALDGFSANGKLYGLPRNSDFFVIYYNKKIFADNGITPPKTDAELIKAVDVLKAKNIIPIAMDGRDQWVSGLWFDNLLQRASGTFDTSKKAMDRSGSFKDPATTAAAATVQKWIDSGVFGKGFLNQDYGAARNMFGQGKAAMYMMGNWEMGMASDDNFPEEVRSNIGAMSMPMIDGGQGKDTDLLAWFGGGYSISNSSKHKEEAIAFLKWMFKPENWAKGVWQNGVTFPAQKYDQFLTGSETLVQIDLSEMFNNATSYSGTPSQDKFTADTQKTFYDTLSKLELKSATPEEFVNTIDEAAEKSANAAK
jgi:raffinose/stachyose/melibiose transport system substrate-binding protein